MSFTAPPFGISLFYSTDQHSLFTAQFPTVHQKTTKPIPKKIVKPPKLIVPVSRSASHPPYTVSSHYPHLLSRTISVTPPRVQSARAVYDTGPRTGSSILTLLPSIVTNFIFVRIMLSARLTHQETAVPEKLGWNMCFCFFSFFVMYGLIPLGTDGQDQEIRRERRIGLAVGRRMGASYQ